MEEIFYGYGNLVARHNVINLLRQIWHTIIMTVCQTFQIGHPNNLEDGLNRMKKCIRHF